VIGSLSAGKCRPQALSGVVRIATNPKAFQRPDKIGDVLAFGNALLGQPNCRVVNPGTRHWRIFLRFVPEGGRDRQSGAGCLVCGAGHRTRL
jgi:hypothetical protein